MFLEVCYYCFNTWSNCIDIILQTIWNDPVAPALNMTNMTQVIYHKLIDCSLSIVPIETLYSILHYKTVIFSTNININAIYFW